MALDDDIASLINEARLLTNAVDNKVSEINEKVNSAVEEIKNGTVESLRIGIKRVGAHVIKGHPSLLHQHIKTDILRSNPVMVAFNLNGYIYPHGIADTDVSFYVYQDVNYSDVGKLHSYNVKNKGVDTRKVDGIDENILDVTYYFDTDDYLVICISGLNHYSQLNLSNLIAGANSWEFEIIDKKFTDSQDPAFGV